MTTESVSPIAQALGRIPSGMFIVSARDDAGVEGAFLASWVMQAGFEPPMLSVGVGSDRALRQLLDADGARFAVSVIASEEKKQLGPYYKGIDPAPDALAAFEVERTESGLAVVARCLAWLECTRRASVEVGDHCIVLGEVTDARGGRAEEPAVHTRSNGLSY